MRFPRTLGGSCGHGPGHVSCGQSGRLALKGVEFFCDLGLFADQGLQEFDVRGIVL